MTLAQLAFKRFVHRTDVYAEQWHNADEGRTGYRRMTTGVCPENPPCPKRLCTHIKNVPITEDVVQRHIDGELTAGIYQLSDDNTVTWGCIDVDITKRADGPDLEKRVRKQTLAAGRVLHSILGRRFLVEYSGSRGYHLWVFFDEPVQARHVLALLEFAVNKVEDVDGISFEIFPKQTAMRSFGNLVKMPLGIHRKTGNSCLFVDSTFTRIVDQTEALANVNPLSNKELQAFIKDHKMEVPASIRIDPEGVSGKAGKTGLPCMTRMMREGLREGERDIGTFKMACFMQDRGLPMDMAYAAIEKMNERTVPPLDSYTLQMKVESAYVTDYRPFPCDEAALDSYCSSSCRFWPSKRFERWEKFGRNPDDAVGKISRD